MGGNKSYYMPGWCNGTAGMAFLWLRAHAVLAERKYLELAQRSGRDVLDTDGGNPSLWCAALASDHLPVRICLTRVPLGGPAFCRRFVLCGLLPPA